MSYKSKLIEFSGRRDSRSKFGGPITKDELLFASSPEVEGRWQNLLKSHSVKEEDLTEEEFYHYGILLALSFSPKVKFK